MKGKGSTSGSGRKGSQKSLSPSDSKNSSKSSMRKKKKHGASETKQRSASEEQSAARNSRSRKSSPSQPVIGLDLSLTATGLVVWNGEQVLRRRRYKTEPVAPSDGLKARPQGQLARDRFKGSEDERIEWLRRKVAANIRKFQPILVVIEGHSFGSQGRGKTILAELHGVVKNQLLRMEMIYVLVAPPTLKKFATGDGRADKVTMIGAAKQFDRELGTDDEADALHLARFGMENLSDLVDL